MLRKGWILLTLFCLILAAVIVADAAPWLRGPAPGTSEWYWPYRLRPVGRWWAAVLPATAIVLLGVVWLKTRVADRWAWFFLAVLSGLHLALQAGVIFADRGAVTPELIDRTLAPLTNGYFWTAARIEQIDPILRDYAAWMTRFESEHARTHPPGLVWLNWLTIRALGDSADPLAVAAIGARCTDLWLLGQPLSVARALTLWAWLPLVAATLVPWPAYGVARALAPDRPRGAALAALLTAALPSAALFAPQSDQLFPLLILSALWAAVVATRRRHGGYGLALFAGLCLSVATFLSLGNAAFALVPGVVGGWQLWRARAGWRRVAGLAAVFGAGCLAVWLLFWAVWGVSPLTIASTGLDQHYTLVTNFRRYRWWVVYNLVDLVLFAGPVVIVGWLLALRGRAQDGWRRVTVTQSVALALVLLVLLLDLSGGTRGETGRIWLFLMGPLAVTAGIGWSGLGTRAAATLLAAQLVVLLALGVAWRPLEAVVVGIQPPAGVEAAVEPAVPVGAMYEEGLVLDGYSAVITPEAVELTLAWRAEAPTLTAYTVFVHLVASDGTIVAQADGWPVDNQWPPTCWSADAPVADRRSLPLTEVPPGRYDVRVGWYDAADGTRVPLTDGADAWPLFSLTR